MELPKLPQSMGTWGGPAKALAQDTGTPWCPDLHVTLGNQVSFLRIKLEEIKKIVVKVK